MDVKQVKTSEIKAYAKNAKKHPEEQVKLIANSIKEFGFQQPIVIDKDNIVVIGHGRLLAENCFLSTKKEEHYALCL